jgi:hypothetical protein
MDAEVENKESELPNRMRKMRSMPDETPGMKMAQTGEVDMPGGQMEGRVVQGRPIHLGFSSAQNSHISRGQAQI